jgi:hypothetical protein
MVLIIDLERLLGWERLPLFGFWLCRNDKMFNGKKNLSCMLFTGVPGRFAYSHLFNR